MGQDAPRTDCRTLPRPPYGLPYGLPCGQAMSLRSIGAGPVFAKASAVALRAMADRSTGRLLQPLVGEPGVDWRAVDLADREVRG